MDKEHTLLDVIHRLTECLEELDKLGAGVAAAHLSACLDALQEGRGPDGQLSETE